MDDGKGQQVGDNEDELRLRCEQMLAPLRQQGHQGEYECLLKEMMEMDGRLRVAETAYAETYSRLASLEKQIASYRDAWQYEGLST